MHKLATATAMMAAAITLTAGTAGAAPEPAPEAIGYTATTTETSTVITTDSGSLAVEDGVFKIKAANGATVAGTELSFRVDDFVFPIKAELDDRTGTLTPQFDTAHAVYQPVALPYETESTFQTEFQREQAAWARMASTIQLGAGIGTMVGGIGGAAVGCLLGGVAGATVAAATIIGLFGPFLPAAAIGCIGGVMAVGSLGSLAGTILVAAPVAILAAVQYFSTINQPAPTPRPQPAK